MKTLLHNQMCKVNGKGGVKSMLLNNFRIVINNSIVCNIFLFDQQIHAESFLRLSLENNELINRFEEFGYYDEKMPLGGFSYLKWDWKEMTNED